MARNIEIKARIDSVQLLLEVMLAEGELADVGMREAGDLMARLGVDD